MFPDIIIPPVFGFVLFYGGAVGMIVCAGTIVAPHLGFKSKNLHPLIRGNSEHQPHHADTMAYWCIVEEMKLWQAAHLWAGEIPSRKQTPLSPQVGAQLDRLQKAASRGDLQTVMEPENASFTRLITGALINRGVHANVSREALKSYAVNRGERPSFLFS